MLEKMARRIENNKTVLLPSIPQLSEWSVADRVILNAILTDAHNATILGAKSEDLAILGVRLRHTVNRTIRSGGRLKRIKRMHRQLVNKILIYNATVGLCNVAHNACVVGKDVRINTRCGTSFVTIEPFAGKGAMIAFMLDHDKLDKDASIDSLLSTVVCCGFSVVEWVGGKYPSDMESICYGVLTRGGLDYESIISKDI